MKIMERTRKPRAHLSLGRHSRNQKELVDELCKYGVSGTSRLPTEEDDVEKIINENDCTCGLNECDKIEFCVNTDATVLNINAAASCVCGWNTCTISNGLYCTSMQDECSWKYDPCTNTFGNIVNENACTCVSLYNLVLVLRCYFLIVVFLSLTFFYLSIYLFIALHFFLRV